MKKIAIVFSRSPYGSSLGKEGLDFALSASCFTNKLGIFFIGDGIFQIFKNQNSERILLKNFSSSFGILSLFDINNIYLCYDSLRERGFTKNIDLTVKIIFLNIKKIIQKINKFDFILNF